MANALLLPVVLGLLPALEAGALPPRWRTRGARKYLAWAHAPWSFHSGRPARLSARFSPQQILDQLMLCGWYHAVSFTARATRLPPEPGAPRFDTVRTSTGRADLGPDTTRPLG